LKKGRDGERDVAEILDELKRQGANVLHDIPGEQGNIDHVVICSHGIFVVETKAWNKPENIWEMDFDGERIHIATRGPDAAPIVQCKAEVGDIILLLKESTSKTFPVRGVVVFLDWFVNRKPGGLRALLRRRGAGNRDECASISIPRRGGRDPSVPLFPRSCRLAIQSTPLRSGPTARKSRVRTRCSVGNGHAFLRGAGEEDHVHRWSINRLRECLTYLLIGVRFVLHSFSLYSPNLPRETGGGLWRPFNSDE